MLILDGDGTTESGRQAAEHMFVRDVLPTAFLCVNDATALGVIIALNARGYDLPRQFSVMGFDDISFASFVTPSLTTMKQPRSKIGEAAMNLLLAVVEGRPLETAPGAAAQRTHPAQFRRSPCRRRARALARHRRQLSGICTPVPLQRSKSRDRRRTARHATPRHRPICIRSSNGESICPNTRSLRPPRLPPSC